MFKMMKMKYFLALLSLTASLYIFFLFSSLPNQAAAATGVVTGSVVNIRAGGGTQYAVAGTVYKDTKVTILSQSGEWYQIQCGKTVGWVNQSLLSVTQSDISITVSQDLVNLRSGPGTTYNIIGQARKGETLTLWDVSGDWYKAKTASGQEVYIRSDMIQPSTGNTVPAVAVTTPPTVAAPTQAKTPIVMMDGRQMQFEVSPIIENGRTLVPLRAIFEAMGAQVQWNDTTQTVTATRGSITVILTIGSTSPTINGKVWPLDVSAKIVNGRTLAPLRFIGEALGGTVTWDDAAYTVKMQSPPADGTVVTAVTISDAVNLRSGPDTTYAIIGSAISGETLPVVAQQNDWYQVSRGGTRVWVAGWVVNPVTSVQATDPPVVPDPVPEPVKELEGLTLSSQRTADGLRIMMESAVKLDKTISKTTNQVSYVFANRQIEGTGSLREYLGAAVLNASGSNQGDNVVVNIQLPSGVQYTTATENDGRREVLIIPNYIDSVSRQTFGSSGENITVSTVVPLTYTSTITSTKLTVVLDNTSLGSAASSYSYSSPLISSMGFKIQTVNGKTQTVLTIITKKAAKFAVGPSASGSAVNIMFIDQSEIQSRVPIVVLDAGHGGRDPGASGDYLSEKDVNLAVVQKVGQLLTAKGIKVVYTRSDDTYVSLDDRSNIANIYNASVFVSVHANASTSSTPSGTETYCYYPLENPQLYLQKEERYNLALRLQQSLVASLGRIDRGVKQGNLSVLRESIMPSALVEMAFISNPTEEALLQQQQFRDLAAKAIADAIAGYMQAYVK